MRSKTKLSQFLRVFLRTLTLALKIFCRLSEQTGAIILREAVFDYVKDTFSCKRRTDLELRDQEALWIEIHVKSRKMLPAAGLYRQPKSNTAYFDLVAERHRERIWHKYI